MSFRWLLVWLVLLNGQRLWAQGPAWNMALGLIGDEGGPLVEAMAANTEGDVFLTGSFYNTATFGATTLQASSASKKGAFLAKWNIATQTFRWAMLLGTAGDSRATVATDSARHVYVAGSFGYLLRITDNGLVGVVDWAQPVAATIRSIAVQKASVYVAGAFAGPLNLGRVTLQGSGQDNLDIFVARYDDATTTALLQWAQEAGGSEDEEPAAVAVAGANVYLAGYTGSRQTQFGPLALRNTNDDYSTDDGFVTKLVDNGQVATFTWVLSAGSYGHDELIGVAASEGHLYVAGNMFETARPDAVGHFGTTTLTYKATPQVVVAKLADEGSSYRIDWITTDTYGASLGAMAVRGRDLYLTGTGSSTSVGSYVLQPACRGVAHLLLAKLTDETTTGRYQWVQGSDGEASSHGGITLAVSTTGPTVLVSGIVYMTGISVETAVFGQLRLSGPGNVVLASLVDTSTHSGALTSLADASLFPNPARTTATLRLPTVPGATQATIRWYSALGQLVRIQPESLSFPDTTLELSLAGLATGLYHLHIEAGGQRVTRTILVE